MSTDKPTKKRSDKSARKSTKKPAKKAKAAVSRPEDTRPTTMAEALDFLFAGMDGKPRKSRGKQFSKHPKLDEYGEEKKCFICGATSNLVRTPCCGKWICDDESDYMLFSYARNSCSRNHRRYTLCGAHHAENHEGDWKTCKECRESAEPEMVAWFGTNEYNWETMPDPPTFEPTLCHKCGKRIVLSEGGYTLGRDGYTCSDCHEW